MTQTAPSIADAVKHHQSGRRDVARRMYEDILRIDPRHSDALHLLGVLAHQEGQPLSAVDHIGRAIVQRTRTAEYHNNLAAAYHAAGRTDEAIASYQRAIELKPDYADAHYNLAELLKEQGRTDESIAAYREALELMPDCVQIRSALGSALYDAERFDEARDCFYQIVRIDPENAQAQLCLADCLRKLDQLEQARDHYRLALSGQTEQPLRNVWLATLCPAVFESTDEIANYRDRLIGELKQATQHGSQLNAAEVEHRLCPPPYELQYHGLDDRPFKEAYANVFRDCFQALPPVRGSGKPRVGFVVTGGHEPTFLRCMRGIIERLNSELFDLSIICTRAAAPRIGAEIPDASVGLHVIPDRFEHVVDSVRDAAFDVLYYWEVGSDVTNYFLPFFSPAPVQCTGWGVPVTTGIPQMNHFLSSALVEPADADAHYSERLIRAKTLLTWQDRVRPPEVHKPRGAFGFMRSEHFYLCVQQTLKVHPDFDALLGEILRRDRGGHVVMISDKRRYAARKLRARLRASLGDVSDRILFLPQQTVPDYLNLLRAADVVLDTPHFGGGITTYDALSLNKPIVTLPTAFRRGRFTTACYMLAGVLDCVARSADEYVSTAVRLACDRDWRWDVECRIGQSSNALFENTSAVREFERILLSLVDEARHGP